MTNRLRAPLLFVIVGLIGMTGLTFARQAPTGSGAATAALTQTIPVDPQITTGTFPNGLRYYIRANKKPEKRAELRLVVNAGSILEDDDQRGLAHFVEHMAFNGTKHFPKQDIVTFMESLGMRFGADVNAYTSFDETVYMLQVPTDKPEVIDRSLLILEDWAHNVSFDAGGDRQGARRHHRGVAAAAAAPARACRTSSSRSCSRARATPIGCRSARRRSSRTSSTTG